MGRSLGRWSRPQISECGVREGAKAREDFQRWGHSCVSFSPPHLPGLELNTQSWDGFECQL